MQGRGKSDPGEKSQARMPGRSQHKAGLLAREARGGAGRRSTNQSWFWSPPHALPAKTAQPESPPHDPLRDSSPQQQLVGWGLIFCLALFLIFWCWNGTQGLRHTERPPLRPTLSHSIYLSKIQVTLAHWTCGQLVLWPVLPAPASHDQQVAAPGSEPLGSQGALSSAQPPSKLSLAVCTFLGLRNSQHAPPRECCEGARVWPAASQVFEVGSFVLCSHLDISNPGMRRRTNGPFFLLFFVCVTQGFTCVSQMYHRAPSPALFTLR